MTYRDRADRIAALIEDRLGIRGNGLKVKLRRAGRLLPRHVRQDAMRLLDAAVWQDHPKLARRIDERSVDAACRALESYLRGVDGKQRRINRIADFLTSTAVALLATGVLVLVVLRLRGYL